MFRLAVVALSVLNSSLVRSASVEMFFFKLIVLAFETQHVVLFFSLSHPLSHSHTLSHTHIHLCSISVMRTSVLLSLSP